METVQLFTLGLAIFIFVVVFRRRTGYARPVPVLPSIVVRDPAVARRMLFDHADAFSDRGVSSFPVDFNGTRHQKRYTINTVPFGPEWRAFRCNLTSEILHPSRLGRLGQFQREAVRALVADLSAHCPGEVLVRESIHRAIFPLLIRLCFGDGVDARHTHAIQIALKDFFLDLNPARALAPSRLARLRNWRRWIRFAGTFDRLNALFSPLVEERRQQQRSKCGGGGVQSYVDSLLVLQVPDDDNTGGKRSLRNDQISALVWEFLGAGTLTVVSTIEWILTHLIIQPEIQRKLYQEIAGDNVLTEERLRRFPYLRAVMLESLRLYPPVPFIIRDASGSEAAKACGASAMARSVSRKKTPVADCPLVHFIVSLRDIGCNRDAWTDPEKFIPDRFLVGGEGEHVSPIPGSKEIKMMPFGAGTRSCPGAGLGMLHIKMFLAALVREFQWVPVAGNGGGVDLSENNGFFKVMKTPLRTRITPRRSK